MTGPGARPYSTWTLWLFERLPLSPPWVGALLGLSLYLVFLGYTYAFGPSVGVLAGSSIENAWGAELILALVTGFAPTVTTYTLRGSLRDLEDLRGALHCSDDEFAALRGEITGYRAAPLRLVGTVGAVVSAFVAFDLDIWLDGRPPLGDPALTWIVVRNSLNGWMVSRALYLEITLARSFSRLGDRLGEVDLLDPDLLNTFGRRGLRSVLLWMLFVAFYSLLYTGNWAADLLPIALVGIAAYGIIGFLLPVVGARRRIRSEKRAELVRVRTAIHDLRESVLRHEPDARPPGGQLADLLAYESRIASVREWPFDAPTLLRWALYVALGLSSWLGGALVERALGTLLD
ncbi:MAG: hypothetical protein V3T14_06915 [Myxococcota bacterium]